MKKIKALVAAAVLVASTSSFSVPALANTVTNTNNTVAIENTTELSEIDSKKADMEYKDAIEAKDANGYKLTFDYSYGDNEGFIVNNTNSDLYGQSLSQYLNSFGESLIKDENDSTRPDIKADLIFDSGLSSLYKMTFFVVKSDTTLGKQYIQPYTIELNKDKKDGIDDQVPTYEIKLSDRSAMERLKNQLGNAIQNQGYKVEHDSTAVNGVYKVKVTKDGVTAAMLNLYEETVSYSTHVQNIGWQDTKTNGIMSGTEGQALRLEGIKLDLNNMPEGSSIEYRTHVQNIGWQDWKSNGEMSGTEGQALRLEGIEIKLSDDLAKYYDVEYRTHVENIGWQDWVKNGEMSGTEGQALRLEGIEVRLVSKIAH